MYSLISLIQKNSKLFSLWIKGLFTDEAGSPSSKRFVGILCSLTLCIALYKNSSPSSHLVDAVTLLAISTLGLSSVDKFIKTKNKTDN